MTIHAVPDGVDGRQAFIGLDSDSKPTQGVQRGAIFIDDQGYQWQWSGSAWIPAAQVNHAEFPRLPVSPSIDSVAAGELLADCDSGTIQEVRFVINPGNDNEAADALANGINGSWAWPADFADSVTSGAAITDVYAIVIGNGGTDSGGDNIVDSSSVKNINGQLATTVGTVAMIDVTAAELVAATNMLHWEFDEADNVRLFSVVLHAPFDSTTQMRISASGRSFNE